jgi:TetR/AcrR family fatty acid metabolism transcriptional regulator
VSVQEERLKTREKEILNRAKTLFSEKGFHNLTVSDIVNSLGIARGTFYLYFKNKNNVYRRVLEELVSEISSKLKIVPKENPVEQLRENLKNVLNLFKEDKELALLILQHPYKLNPEFDRLINEFFEKVYGLVEHSLLTGMEMEIVRKCNVKVVSRTIVGAFLEVGKGILSGEVEVEEAVEELLNLTFKGILEA